MTFYVGQKVECIGGEIEPRYEYDQSIKGEIYTVSAVDVHNGTEYLCFYELYSPETNVFWAGEPSEYFRPVVERKTSIEVFKAMLNPSHEEVSA